MIKIIQQITQSDKVDNSLRKPNVWHKEAQGKGSNRKVIRLIQRRMAIRTIRAYQTVLFQTAAALARWDLQAEAKAEAYHQV